MVNPKNGRQGVWRAKCSGGCGTQISVTRKQIKQGVRIRCGRCYQRDLDIERRRVAEQLSAEAAKG